MRRFLNCCKNCERACLDKFGGYCFVDSNIFATVCRLACMRRTYLYRTYTGYGNVNFAQIWRHEPARKSCFHGDPSHQSGCALCGASLTFFDSRNEIDIQPWACKILLHPSLPRPSSPSGGPGRPTAAAAAATCARPSSVTVTKTDLGVILY